MKARIIPYISLGSASAIVYLLSIIIVDETATTILRGVFSNSIFFFLVYLFYDMIRQSIIRKEKKLLTEFIKRRFSNDLFVSLYFIKKIIHGYNLESNTVVNILKLVSYSEKEIHRSMLNQNYLGFQILRKIDEVRMLLDETLDSNIVLHYSSHTDISQLLLLSNLLARLESALKNRENFHETAETGLEFAVLAGKALNPVNDDKILLVKKTQHPNRYVVYDSGYFDPEDKDHLLKRFVLKDQYAAGIAALVHQILSIMRIWLPEATTLKRREKRFRIIKDFFSPNTHVITKDVEIHVADIIQDSNKA